MLARMLRPRRRLVTCAGAAWLLLAGSAVAQEWSDHLRVSFIDVGQGDAVLIQTPGTPGKTILIDGGPDRGVRNRVPAFLNSFELPPDSIIDYVVLTHPHEDHYGGLIDVLEQWQVRTIVDSGYPSSNVGYQTFLARAQTETVDGEPATYVSLRDEPRVTLDWGPGVEALIVWADQPDATDLGSGSTRVNNASVVVRMTFGAFSFLFVGDAEGKARSQPATTVRYLEQRLLTEQVELLPTTVLKVGHHGSETSSTLPFIRTVQPRVAVVMSGRRSFSGIYLPDQSVLDRYEAEVPGITIVRTDYLDAEEGRTSANDEDGDDILLFTLGGTLDVFQARLQDDSREWVHIATIPQ